ncbi:hypothetical protein [Microbispora rosea]|uniref:hypothetical protein n=1 Tax=Microbispora rosea TaxID=58117 RepID=UPI0037ADBA0B
MAPHTTPVQIDPTVERLVTNALTYAARHGGATTLRAAAAIHDRPPIDLLVALRSKPGKPIIVTVHVYGRDVDVEVNPNGRIDRAAEQRAWNCIRDILARDLLTDAA